MEYKKPDIKSYSARDILEEIGPCQNQYTTTTFLTTTGNSSVNVDGYTTSSGFAYATGQIHLGDDPSNFTDRGLVGFDISTIQGRTIVSATLRLYQTDPTATPYADLGNILVDHVNFGSSIDASDYSSGTLTSNIGTISTNNTLEWKTLDVASYVQADLDAGRTSSQFRIRFTVDTDNDSDGDSTNFEDADNDGGTGNRPELVVTYS